MNAAVLNRERLATENVRTSCARQVLQKDVYVSPGRIEIAGIDEGHAHMRGVEADHGPVDITGDPYGQAGCGLLQ